MTELSLHILDIVQNSISAGASLIEILIYEDTGKDVFSFEIKDDGSGMSEEFVKNVCDPFVTTRRTRPVGLGLSLLKAAAEMTGGSFNIESELGRGTAIFAGFRHSSIDRQPLGNISETLCSLITSNVGIDFLYKHTKDGIDFLVDTREIKAILGEGADLNTAEVYVWLKGYLEDGENELQGLQE